MLAQDLKHYIVSTALLDELITLAEESGKFQDLYDGFYEVYNLDQHIDAQGFVAEDVTCDFFEVLANIAAFEFIDYFDYIFMLECLSLIGMPEAIYILFCSTKRRLEYSEVPLELLRHEMATKATTVSIFNGYLACFDYDRQTHSFNELLSFIRLAQEGNANKMLIKK